MATGKESGTTIDALKKVHAELAQALLNPDSAQHMQFITQGMATIQSYIASQGMQAMGRPMPGGGSPGAAGGPGQPPPQLQQGPQGVQGPAGGLPNPQPGGPAQNPNIMAANPDELRRVLQATGTSQ